MAQPEPNTRHSDLRNGGALPGETGAFAQRVQTLTQVAATEITPMPDPWSAIEPRLRERQANRGGLRSVLLPGRPAPARTTFDGWSGARPVWGALTALVVVCLLLGAFAWYVTAGQIGAVHTGNPLAHAQATVHGVTIKVDNVVADPTRTLISYHIEGLTAAQSASLFVVPILLDGHGHALQYLGGDGPGLSSDSLAIGDAQFPPLPPSELTAAQTLTFYVDELEFTPQSANPQAPQTLVGPWQVVFPVTPQVGKFILTPSAPVSHSGITVQVERVEWAPTADTAFQVDENYDVVSLTLRISGLPHDVAPTVGVQTSYMGLSSGGGSPSPSTATITLANHAALTPAFVYPINMPVELNGVHYYFPYTPATSGTVEVGISFLASAPTAQTAFTFTLHNVQYQPNTKSIIVDQHPVVVPGDWVFQIS